MRLNDKTKQYLDNKCREQWGLTFDQVYNMIEQNEKLKEENKKIKKQIKNG